MAIHEIGICLVCGKKFNASRSLSAPAKLYCPKHDPDNKIKKKLMKKIRSFLTKEDIKNNKLPIIYG
jgi:hypothetical protein